MTAQLASRSEPFGYDTWLRQDIDPSGRAASGVELVTNAIYHRITCERLLLIGSPDDDGDGFVEYGEDVRKWPGEVTSQDLANAKAPRLALVIQRDPRIDRASVNVTIEVQPRGAKYDLRITIECRTTTQLPIRLVVNVNAVTVDILAQGK